MRSSLRRLALLAAGIAALTSVTTGAAHAERLKFSDKQGDVWSLDMNEIPDDLDSFRDLPFESAPGVRNGDIERTTLVHGPRNVTVRVDFVALRRVGEFRDDFLMFRTNEGQRRMVMLFAGEGMWRGDMFILKPRTGEEVDCGAQHKIDYAADTVSITMPRACLGDPRWVQLRAEAGWIRFQAGRVFGDNAHNRSPINFQFTQRVYAG